MKPELAARLSARPRPPFVRWEPEQRCSAKSWLEDASSVLVGAFPYHSRITRARDAKRGYISPFAGAPDYHGLVSSRLEGLAEFIGKLKPGTHCKVQVDSGPGCERLYALRAGVGWQGKNNFIIVPGFGSQVWLGLLAVSLELPLDQPMASMCGDCDLCLRACPTGAYSGPHSFDHQRCMAFWAADKKDLSREQRNILGKHRIIYGCDYCQLVCPHTQTGDESHCWQELGWLLELSREEFEAVFKDTAAAWRGHDVLKRNVILAASGSPELRGVLEKLARGDDKVAIFARQVLDDFPDP